VIPTWYHFQWYVGDFDTPHLSVLSLGLRVETVLEHGLTSDAKMVEDVTLQTMGNGITIQKMHLFHFSVKVIFIN
jgi:hypothetical protein